jgi:hypothetical protein
MFLIIPIDCFNENNVYLAETTKNNVINNSLFTRLLYSTKYYNLNGIYMDFKIKVNFIDKKYNKYKCYFNIYENQQICNKLLSIESFLLKKYLHITTNKTPHYILSEQINSNFIKFNNINSLLFNIKPLSICDEETTLYLYFKISGIWETENKFGLTFKIHN